MAVAALQIEKSDLGKTVGTLLEQLARQDEKLQAANHRVDHLTSINEELKAINEGAALSTKQCDDEKKDLKQQVTGLRDELEQHDLELKQLVARLRVVVAPRDFQELLKKFCGERERVLSPETLVNF